MKFGGTPKGGHRDSPPPGSASELNRVDILQEPLSHQPTALVYCRSSTGALDEVGGGGSLCHVSILRISNVALWNLRNDHVEMSN